jgi:hypothetical protein
MINEAGVDDGMEPIVSLHKRFPQRITTGLSPVFLMIVIVSNALKMGGILWRT